MNQIKLKDTKIYIKLLRNYEKDFGTDGVELSNLADCDDYQFWTKVFKPISDGYYPKIIIGLFNCSNERASYIVFKKKER